MNSERDFSCLYLCVPQLPQRLKRHFRGLGCPMDGHEGLRRHSLGLFPMPGNHVAQAGVQRKRKHWKCVELSRKLPEPSCKWRGARAAEWAGLENRCAFGYRGFESRPLRSRKPYKMGLSLLTVPHSARTIPSRPRPNRCGPTSGTRENFSCGPAQWTRRRSTRRPSKNIFHSCDRRARAIRRYSTRGARSAGYAPTW